MICGFANMKLPNPIQRHSLKIVGLTITWYACSALSSNLSKVILTSLPFPATMTLVEQIVAVISPMRSASLRASMWNLPMRSIFWRGFVLGTTQMLASTLHRVALMHIAVSFTHSLKATQPLFAAALSVCLLGERIGSGALLSLVVISTGALLATFHEASFNMFGFLAALGSTALLAARAVMAKQFLVDLPVEPSVFVAIAKGFSLITLLPIWCASDLIALLHSNVLWNPICIAQLLVNALVITLGATSSIAVLAAVSPVSHAVINSLKRIVVIIAAVIYFQNPVSSPQALGICLTLYGTHLYSQAKRVSKDPALIGDMGTQMQVKTLEC